jgi:3-methylcrotonyl-CoA carboxylase alpha subunit
MYESVLVANRGEIARRVFRTLRRLGIRAVAVHTDSDRHAPHVREADDALRVASYLDVEAILEAAERSSAAAIHPGYGFLSENPALPRACAAAGVAFVGPPAEAMELLGDKLRAKAVAAEAGLPVVPQFTVEEARAADCYPLLVKAAAGGGGRGMRVVEAPERLDEALASARREAQAGFGDDRVFVERYLPRARHIEVQLMGAVALGERECSLQRRHQKLVEEAPSPVVGPELRARLCDEAEALARAVGYANAGTVEFIADFDDPATHYFLEVNARLQVEHPVTEAVTGLDLVELQLRAAAGEDLGLERPPLRGHAIEARVTAEDAAAGFLPSAGRVLAYRRPASVRVDDAIETGTEVGTEYDSLVAKVIAHGPDREIALARLRRALADTAILGVTTTTGFLRDLLARDDVRAGAIDTGLVEREMQQMSTTPLLRGEVAPAGARVMLALAAEAAGDDPFARVDGWRLAGRRAPSRFVFHVDGGEAVGVDARLGDAEIERLGPDVLAIGGTPWVYALDGDTLWLGRGGATWRLRPRSFDEVAGAAGAGDLRAPMPGQVLLVPAEVGATVKAGDPVVVLESMKMELSITAPADGVVAEIAVAVGEKVAQDQPLARVEAEA